MRGLGEFFWDDSFSTDFPDYYFDSTDFPDYYFDSTDFPDYYFDSPLVEVSAPDGEFTEQTEVLEYNAPIVYDLPSESATDLVSQGYTQDEEPSGGSTMYSGSPATQNLDFQTTGGATQASYGDSRAGQSSFIRASDVLPLVPTLLKTISDHKLQEMRLEIEKARTMPGRSLPTLGGKAVSSVRPDPANPKMQLVTYADGSMARVPVASAGGGGWQTPALLALGAAGLFLLLRRR